MQPGNLYDVVRPLGKSTAKTQVPAPPLSGLEGKKVGFVWSIFPNGDIVAEALMDYFGKTIRGFEGVKLPPGKGASWGNTPTRAL